MRIMQQNNLELPRPKTSYVTAISIEVGVKSVKAVVKGGTGTSSRPDNKLLDRVSHGQIYFYAYYCGVGRYLF
jgi:hypothetical protein